MSLSEAPQRPTSVVDPHLAGLQDRRGMVTMIAVMVAAFAVLLSLVIGGFEKPLPLMALALLSIFGVFFLFALAAGHIHLGERTPDAHFAATLAETLDHAVQITARDGQIMWANSAFRGFVGQASAGAAGSLADALGTSSAVSEAMFRLTQAAEDGGFHREEIVCQGTGAAAHRGGTEKGPSTAIYRITVRPVVGHASTVEFGTLSQWLIEDITVDRHRERADLDRVGKLQRQFDMLPMGLVSLDGEGRILEANATLCKWLSLSPSDASNLKTLADIFAPADARAVLRAASQDKSTASHTTLDMTTDEGQLLPVDVAARADRATGGYWIAVARHMPDDLAEQVADAGLAPPEPGAETQRAARRALRSLDPQNVKRFFQAAPFGIATLSADGQIVDANTTFARLLQRSDSDDNPSATIADVLTAEADADTTKVIRDGLTRVQSGLGNVAPIDIAVGGDLKLARRVYMHPLSPRGDSADVAALYVLDVTEQKALEEKFAQSHKMEAVGKLAGGIAHDFNNVLTAIIGVSDLLLQTHRPTDPAYKDIKSIQSSAKRAAGLVGKLLAFSRRQTFQTEVLQVEGIIATNADMLKRMLPEIIKLRVHSERDQWFVKTDPTQLDQVLVNLGVNARDAMSDGGTLTFASRNISEREVRKLGETGMPVGEFVLIEVTDTGTGMSADVQRKIFEPFFTTKDVGKGTGLGLSTVYGVVKQAGGYIYCDSTEGEGTTFRIYLPRHHVEDAEADAEARALEKANAAQARKKDLTGTGRVLLVEDEDIVRSFAVRALRRQGYEVLEASTGVEALEVMAQNEGKIDIVVSDVVMPEMDGPTLLKELRRTNPDLKIIFVSGYPNEAFQEALGQETFAFLPKPFSLPELADKVKSELAA